MAGNNRQKKSSFSLFSLFKSKSSSRARRGDDTADEYMKACKVYPGDDDRGRYVADPKINEKASRYILLTTDKWGKVDAAN